MDLLENSIMQKIYMNILKFKFKKWSIKNHNHNFDEDEFRDELNRTGIDVEHFLDHKVANVSQGLKALGRADEANAFRNEYQSYVDNPFGYENYESANNLVNRGTKEVMLARYKNVKPMLNKEELDLI